MANNSKTGFAGIDIQSEALTEIAYHPLLSIRGIVLATQIALNLTRASGKGVALFSLEQAADLSKGIIFLYGGNLRENRAMPPAKTEHTRIEPLKNH